MPSFLLKFALVSKFALLFWKLLVSEFLLGISEILHCSMCTHVETVPLLDVHQLLMLFAETFKYSEPGTFSCVIYYNDIIAVIIIIIIICIIYKYIFNFSILFMLVQLLLLLLFVLFINVCI
jgi:hypothetical protein